MGRAPQIVRKQSITRQAALRLIVSLGLLVALIALSTSLIYRATLGKSVADRADNLAVFYQARLMQLEREWELQSRDFKVRIEVTRLLEQQPVAAAGLQAFMTVQGTHRRFQYLLVQDRQQQKLFAFGTDLSLGRIPLGSEAANGWHLDSATGNLYRVFVDKIWLGKAGQGRVALFYRVDNGVLQQLATPGIALAALYKGGPVASSQGQAGIDQLLRSTRPVVADRREIPWTHETDSPTRIRIDAPFTALFTNTELVIGGSLIPLVDGLILWFTLGTWLMRKARRIKRLGNAVEEFAAQQRITPHLEYELASASNQQNDEIHEVASAVRSMAEQTVHREQEHIAFEQKLGESERRFRDVAESAGEFIWEIDARQILQYLSDKAGEVFGLPVEELIGTCIFDYLDQDGHAEMCRQIQETARNGTPFRKFELHICRPDGSCRWVAFTGTPILDAENRRSGAYRGTAEDVTQHKRDVESLQLAEKVFANSDQAVLITDAQANILSVNPAFCAITGYSAAEAVGQNPRMFSSGRHDAAFYAAMWGEIGRSGAWAGEVWDRRKNGDIYPKWLSINAVQDPLSSHVTHYVAIFSDITERKENEARIEHLAYHDPLTSLPNRFALQARLTQSLADARRNDQQLAVMFIDLDHFKNINDSLGHDIGDQLLMEVACRIRSALREADTVARLGGDEFVIVVSGIAAPEDAARVAEKVIELVGEPLVLAGHTLHTSPSIGIGIFPADGSDGDTLMKNADTAMYHAKQHGRNTYHFFTADMNVAATERLLLETQLRAALDRQEMHLVYQPQVDLASGTVTGVEALLRWHHPERGLVPPLQFIPIAEETGLIIPLGAWVLEEACRQAVTWSQAGLPPLRMAVNLSVHQFRDRNLARYVAATLAHTGLPADRLELEITESVAMENAEQTIELLRSLRDLGVQLAIDDFGTGYSSLAYLKRFPIDRLKIDRSFVMDLDRDVSDAAIVRSIVVLAHALGVSVIAEGIETASQLAMVKGFKCAEGQGYLFSRPLAAADLAAFIQPPLSSAAPPSPLRLH